MSARDSLQARQRAEALVGLEAGTVDVFEVLRYARTDDGKSLRVLTLRDVLRNAKGVDARVVLNRLAGLGVHDPGAMRLKYAIDNKGLLGRIVDSLVVADRTQLTSGWPFVNECAGFEPNGRGKGSHVKRGRGDRS